MENIAVAPLRAALKLLGLEPQPETLRHVLAHAEWFPSAVLAAAGVHDPDVRSKHQHRIKLALQASAPMTRQVLTALETPASFVDVFDAAFAAPEFFMQVKRAHAGAPAAKDWLRGSLAPRAKAGALACTDRGSTSSAAPAPPAVAEATKALVSEARLKDSAASKCGVMQTVCGESGSLGFGRAIHVQSKQSVLLVEGALPASPRALDNRAGLSICLSQREALAVARVLMGQAAAVETAAGGKGGRRFAMQHARDGFRACLAGSGKRIWATIDSIDAAKLLLLILSAWGQRDRQPSPFGCVEGAKPQLPSLTVDLGVALGDQLANPSASV